MLEGKALFVTDTELNYFSGGDKTSPDFPKQTIHTSKEKARKCGIFSPMASGAMFEGMLSDLMLKATGEEWFNKGKMRIKFVLPVTIGDTIIPYVEKNIGFYDVWCENQRGNKTAVGQAFIGE